MYDFDYEMFLRADGPLAQPYYAQCTCGWRTAFLHGENYMSDLASAHISGVHETPLNPNPIHVPDCTRIPGGSPTTVWYHCQCGWSARRIEGARHRTPLGHLAHGHVERAHQSGRWSIFHSVRGEAHTSEYATRTMPYHGYQITCICGWKGSVYPESDADGVIDLKVQQIALAHDNAAYPGTRPVDPDACPLCQRRDTTTMQVDGRWVCVDEVSCAAAALGRQPGSSAAEQYARTYKEARSRQTIRDDFDWAREKIRRGDIRW